MKKFYLLLTVLYVSIALLGCAQSDTLKISYDQNIRIQEENTKQRLDAEQVQQNRDNAGLSLENIQNIQKNFSEKYAYCVMDPELRQLYAEMYIVLMEHGENVFLTAKSTEDLEYVFYCVFMDHPEIYWVDGYSFIHYQNSGDCEAINFSGSYIYTESECRVKQVAINNYVSKCFAGIKKNASQYDKVKYVYEYVINNTDYVLDAKDNQNILSVFEGQKSVCQGYAKAVQYLLNALDVECTFVPGSILDGTGHGWNLVNIDGRYYYLDATWGDASYIRGKGATGEISQISYDYLNITTDELEKTHIIKSVVTMPMCVSTEANYYVKEGLLLDSYDEYYLSYIFSRAYENGDKILSLKASNQDVYDIVFDNLINQGLVFKFLPAGKENLSYTVYDDSLCIDIWL